MKNYKLFEHTADIGIIVKGKSLKSLFVNAGLAVFDILARKLPGIHAKKRSFSVKQKADTMDELFVNWLNELLSLSSAKGVIFEDIKIQKISDNSIEAIVSGVLSKNYKINTEIKAATYHELKIIKTKAGFQAKVVLDV